MFDYIRKLMNAKAVSQAEAVNGLANLLAVLDNHNKTPVGLAIAKAFEVYASARKNLPRTQIVNGFAQWMGEACIEFEDTAGFLLSGKLDNHTVPSDCEIDFAITGKNISWATAHMLNLTPNAKACRKEFKQKCKDLGMDYVLGTLDSAPIHFPEPDPVEVA